MAVYNDLLLSAGGGVMSTLEKADQQDDTATVLIGLGGTGVHALRTVKTQVYQRLKADNPDSAVKEYQHIRFLGLDTDIASMGIEGDDERPPKKVIPLKASECMYLGQTGGQAVIANHTALRQRHELDWYNEEISPEAINGDGAGAYRQLGRFLLMDRSGDFIRRITEELNAARKGLSNPKTYVHVFTGIGGGTGSGMFLDAFYLIRKAFENMGINASLFGYLFMPDVNLSVVIDNATRNSIQSNGYAAMQELDYCMRLSQNGGAFNQVYKDGTVIRWDQAPMDMCHLIGATDANGNVIDNAYDYAMRVTAEYVTDYLTHTEDPSFTIESQKGNYGKALAVLNGEKRHGFNINACIIGAACASVPFREINTYLASTLFEKYSGISAKEPTSEDVNALFHAVMGKDNEPNGDVYENLLQKINENVSEVMLYSKGYKAAMEEHGGDLTHYYADQSAKISGQIECNGQNMLSDEVSTSLISRLKGEMAKVICDFHRGPIFAQKLLQMGDHPLVTLVDGLIQENERRLGQCLYDYNGQPASARPVYESANEAWNTHRDDVLLAGKYFKEYNRATCNERSVVARLDACTKLGEVLEALKKQLCEIDDKYYKVLRRVTEDLLQTFALNRATFSTAEDSLMYDSFEMPIVTVEDLRDILDERVSAVNYEVEFQHLMSVLLDHPGAWLKEDQTEYKTAKLVNDFFVNHVFSDFANRTICDFLAQKFDTNDEDVLANKIASNIIEPIKEKSMPMFALDENGTGGFAPQEYKHISYPAMVSTICNAVNQRIGIFDNEWNDRQSSLTDRISVSRIRIGIPLSAYRYTKQYERVYYTDGSPGKHYYEGDPVDLATKKPIEENTLNMELKDWRELPSLTPQSLEYDYDVNTVDIVKAQIKEGRMLFDKARPMGLIDDNGFIYTLRCDEEELREALKTLRKGSNTEWVDENGTILPECYRSLRDKLALSQTEKYVPTDGNPMERERILKDYFVAAPVCRKLIAKNIALIDRYIRDADAFAVLESYVQALFLDVIVRDNHTIYYPDDRSGGVEDIILSDRNMVRFPYFEVDLYQAFLKYKELDQDIKSEIKSDVLGRIGIGHDAEKAACRRLASCFTKESLKDYNQLVDGHPLQKEIMSFYYEVKGLFEEHCLMFGIPL